MSSKQEGTLTINLPNVIRTLGEYLYSDPNVALRELLQNAHDTCVAAQVESPGELRPEIHVSTDPYERILVVQDNGAGMSEAEVKKFLTVIGNSRTDEVRKQLENLGRHDVADRLIGRFGIGLLSAFIIGEHVEFRTRSRQPDSKLIVWECDGGAKYQMAVANDEAAPFGTTVTLHVDPRYVGILGKSQLERLIRQYADLLRIPIYLDSNPSPVNVMDAPWDRSGSQEEYFSFLHERYPHDDILDVIPIDINKNEGKTKIKGVLFVPTQQQFIVREHGQVTIYCHRYFVCENDTTLLPSWARFVRGVIDTPSLREMASREAVMRDESFELVQAALGRALLDYLTERHENNLELFREVVTSHNIVIKAWAVASKELFEQIKDFVLFDTDIGKLSLPEYFNRSRLIGDDVLERRIFYFVTPGGPGQYAVLFKARGLHVIDASRFPDLDFLAQYARTTPQVELHRLDLDARGWIFEPLPGKERKWRELESAYADLHVNAEVVSFVPEGIPAVLLNEETEGMDLEQTRNLLADPGLSQMIKSLLQQALNQAERAAARGADIATCYLNANNGIIQKLAEVDLRDPETMEIVRAVYHNALLFSVQGAKLALTQKNAQKIFDGNNRTLATLMTKIFEVNELHSKIQMLQTRVAPANEAQVKAPDGLSGSHHVMCFLAAPFATEYDVLHEALRQVLEDAPYFWEVARADRRFFERTVPDNVARWIARSQCYAVDISGCNPNVMMELGQIYWSYPDRPLLLLERECLKADVVDLGAALRLTYPWSDPPSVDKIAKALREGVTKVVEVAELRSELHYLSTYAMQSVKGIDRKAMSAIAEKYTTIEEFLEKSPEEVASELPDVPYKELVTVIQDSVRSRLARRDVKL